MNINIKVIVGALIGLASLVLLPYIGWTIGTINSHSSTLDVIEATRFTENDGTELTLTFQEALADLKVLVAEIKADVEHLEEGGS